MERIDTGAAVACSLNDAEFSERRALARRTLIPQAVASKRIENGLVVTFIGGDTLRSDLETFVALERACCKFLEFSILRDGAAPHAPLKLHINGQPEATDIIEMFAQAVGQLT